MYCTVTNQSVSKTKLDDNDVISFQNNSHHEIELQPDNDDYAESVCGDNNQEQTTIETAAVVSNTSLIAGETGLHTMVNNSGWGVKRRSHDDAVHVTRYS